MRTCQTFRGVIPMVLAACLIFTGCSKEEVNAPESTNTQAISSPTTPAADDEERGQYLITLDNAILADLDVEALDNSAKTQLINDHIRQELLQVPGLGGIEILRVESNTALVAEVQATLPELAILEALPLVSGILPV